MRIGLVRSAWLLAAVGCALLAGCPKGSTGPTLYKVKGKVVQDGTPVALQNYREGYNSLEVEFFSVDDTGVFKPSPGGKAFVQQDGSFTIIGENAKGLRAGKYRVAVRHVDRATPTGPNRKPDPTGRADAWAGKFDEKKSPFVFDVTGSQGDLVIDLAKPPAAPSK